MAEKKPTTDEKNREESSTTRRIGKKSPFWTILAGDQYKGKKIFTGGIGRRGK